MLGVIRQSQPRSTARVWDANASFNSMTSTAVMSTPVRVELADRRLWSYTHHPRRHADLRHGVHARQRGQPITFHCSIRCNQHGSPSVVDTRGVSRGDSPREKRPQPCQRFNDVSRGCSSRSTTTGSPLRCGAGTGTSLAPISRSKLPLAVRSCERSALQHRVRTNEERGMGKVVSHSLAYRGSGSQQLHAGPLH
jgi:hypothetical protein